MIDKRIYIVILMLVFSAGVFGQRIRFYSSDDGLSSSLVRNIESDANGYIWVATDNGISRYDGFSFVAFHHSDMDSMSVSSDIVNVIYSDSRKRSWVGTMVGLQSFDQTASQFNKFDLRCPPDSRGYHYIYSVAEYQPSNLLLVSIAGWGIMAYDMITNEPDSMMVNWLNSAVGTNFPGSLYVDSKGKLWTHSEMGPCFMIDMETRTVVDYSKKLIEASGLEGISVSTLAELNNGNLLVGCYTNGIYEIDRTRRTVKQIFTSQDLGSPVKVMRKDSSGRMWVGLDGGGLRLLDEKTYKLTIPTFQYYPVDLDNSKVHDIHEDYQGNIWVGLFQKGVVCIPKSTKGFGYIKFTDRPGSTSPNMSCVTSVVVDKDTSLWVGTDGGGLFHTKQGEYMHRIVANDSKLYNNAISALEFDGKGNLWVATYMGGISIRDKDGKWHKLPAHDELSRVRQMVWDNTRKVMIVGTLGHGVMFIDSKDYTFDRPNDLNGWIVSLSLGSDDLLWIGRTEGLVCYDLAKRRMLSNLATEKLDKAVVTDMVESATSYWFSTEIGLYNISKSSDEVKHYNTSYGFKSNHLCSILEDRQGCFWISSSNGLAHFDPKEESVTMYNVHDGLQDNEFINCSSARLGREMMFGGINGLTVFDSESINDDEESLSPIFLSKLTVMNSNVVYDPALGEDNIIDSYLPTAQKITLDWDERMFSLKFGVLEYNNPHNLVYIYRLREFEEGWHTTAQDIPWATYTNLPAGEYTLELKGYRNGGTKSVTRELTIVINPAWWASWWAILINILIVIVILFFSVRLSILRRQRRKEMEEMERKNEQLQMFTNLCHEVRTPLSLVVTPLSVLKASTQGQAHDLMEMVHRNLNRTLRMINQLLDLRRKEDGQESRMLFSKVNMSTFVEDIIAHFEQLAIMRDVKIEKNMTNNVEVWIDLDNFDKVVFNLLSNAFNHTPNEGYIFVSLSAEDGEHCRLSIENTGSYIDPKDMEDIFQLYFQTKQGKRSGSGIGLHISSEIVKAHGGTINVENTDRGVRFTVNLLLGNQHIDENNIADGTCVESVDEPSLIEGSTYVLNQAKVRSEITPTHRTLFILDDDMEWVQFISSMLKPEFDCIQCYNSSDAWQRIVSAVPDVIITDYLMPDINGEELCKKVRRTPEVNHIPIIVVSAEHDDTIKRRLIEAGVDSYLTKPVNIQMLKTTISHVIHMRDILRTKYSMDALCDYGDTDGPDYQFITKVVGLIRQRIEDPTLNVDELCEAVGMSKAHFSRKMKMLLNVSPGGLIKSMRLKQAAFMLVVNKINVSDVAYRLGYSSHSYFTITFRDYYGMSPSYFASFYSKEENAEAFKKLISTKDSFK